VGSRGGRSSVGVRRRRRPRGVAMEAAGCVAPVAARGRRPRGTGGGGAPRHVVGPCARRGAVAKRRPRPGRPLLPRPAGRASGARRSPVTAAERRPHDCLTTPTVPQLGADTVPTRQAVVVKVFPCRAGARRRATRTRADPPPPLQVSAIGGRPSRSKGAPAHEARQRGNQHVFEAPAFPLEPPRAGACGRKREHPPRGWWTMGVAGGGAVAPRRRAEAPTNRSAPRRRRMPPVGHSPPPPRPPVGHSPPPPRRGGAAAVAVRRGAAAASRPSRAPLGGHRLRGVGGWDPRSRDVHRGDTIPTAEGVGHGWPAQSDHPVPAVVRCSRPLDASGAYRNGAAGSGRRRRATAPSRVRMADTGPREGLGRRQLCRRSGAAAMRTCETRHCARGLELERGRWRGRCQRMTRATDLMDGCMAIVYFK